MICESCSKDMKEKRFSNDKPNSTIVRFECECCKKAILICKKKDGSTVSKERFIE